MVTNVSTLNLERQPCPLGCQCDDRTILRGRDRLHGLPGEFTVVRCQTCRLMRTDPRPTRDSIGFYYPTSYGPYQPATSTGEQHSFLSLGWLAAQLLRLDPHRLPAVPTGRLLEVGCAAGTFLHKMAVRGWEVEGIEFSHEAARTARSFGFPVHPGSVETAPEPIRPYDLVVGWNVLEHLHDPISVLERLHKWTKARGWLALSVPDASAWEFKIFRDKWYALHLPNHLYHYTPNTLRAVLARCGWRIERLLWQANPNNLLHSLGYYAADRGWHGLVHFFHEMAGGRRQRVGRALAGIVLGALRQSGRMTVWASRMD